MIVLNDQPGKIGNRLWSFAYFVAFALRTKSTLIVPYFGDYVPVFNDLKIFPNIRFVPFDNGLNFRCSATASRRLVPFRSPCASDLGSISIAPIGEMRISGRRSSTIRQNC